ncbi:MAG TPA: AAA family ATPase [Candidatus Saccharimonadia bacterium]|nr:AAA family ATPase [Candidatus Saccharimonadia bacterium]
MKILVTGNAGSGKSTLSRQLAAHYGLEWYGLDTIVWKEGWQKASTVELNEQMTGLLAKSDWVIDGVSDDILRAADQVVFLDVPRRVSFYRVAKRNWKYLFSSRPDLPVNCPEILIIPKLVKMIWCFPERVRPKILAEKQNRGGKIVHITNNRELRAYLQGLDG